MEEGSDSEVQVPGDEKKLLEWFVNYVSTAIKQSATLKDIKTEFKSRATRFIRVMAKILAVSPIGHSGKGKPAWLFADEVIVQ